MPYTNPFVTTRPLPTQSSPIGRTELDAYLQKYYSGGAADPLNLNQPQMPPSGPDLGAISAGVTGGLNLAANAFGMANQSLGIETQAPGLEFGASGQPVYNTGSFYNQASQARPQGATAGEVLGGAAQGASAGFAAGGPIGAAIGGGVGLVTSLFGGRARKKRQREEKRKATQSARLAQQSFNTADVAFDETQAAQSDYIRRMDNTNRLYNLYN